MAIQMLTLSPGQYKDLEITGMAGPSWRLMCTEHEDMLATEEPAWDRRYAALSRKGRAGVIHVIPIEIEVSNRPRLV